MHFYDVSLTGSLKTVCISQDMLYPGLDQRSRLPISLQKQNVHNTNFHCVGSTRLLKMDGSDTKA